MTDPSLQRERARAGQKRTRDSSAWVRIFFQWNRKIVDCWNYTGRTNLPGMEQSKLLMKGIRTQALYQEEPPDYIGYTHWLLPAKRSPSGLYDICSVTVTGTCAKYSRLRFLGKLPLRCHGSEEYTKTPVGYRFAWHTRVNKYTITAKRDIIL